MFGQMSMGMRGRPATTLAEETPFGTWLRKERQKRGWSGEALAANAGTSQSVVSSLERGTRPATEDMAIRLAVALAGPDASEEEVSRLTNEACQLVLSTEDRIVRSFDPDDPRSNPKLRILDAADDLSLEYIESIAQQAEVAAREFRKLNPRTGTVGKRARDDEE